MVESYRKELALHVGGAGLCKLLNGEVTFLKRTADGSVRETKSKEEVREILGNTDREGGWPIITGGCGFAITLDFMVKLLSVKTDVIMEELLCVIPTLVAFADFMQRQPLYKVTEEEFEYLVGLGHIV